MSSQTTNDGEVLPFDRSDIHEGMGVVDQIVDLGEFTTGRRVTPDGRCAHCGYDRGVYKSHTEIAVESVTCRECDAELYVEDHE